MRRDVLAVSALEHVVRELGGIGVPEVGRFALLGEDEARDVSEGLAYRRAIGVAEVVRDRLQVRHQGTHRALARLRDRQGCRVGVEAGEQTPERVPQPLPEQPQWKRDDADHDVQQLRRAVEDAVGPARGCE